MSNPFWFSRDANDGKEAVFELLGEEGSRDFGDILREEGQKAREDRDRREEDGENTE